MSLGVADVVFVIIVTLLTHDESAAREATLGSNRLPPSSGPLSTYHVSGGSVTPPEAAVYSTRINQNFMVALLRVNVFSLSSLVAKFSKNVVGHTGWAFYSQPNNRG